MKKKRPRRRTHPHPAPTPPLVQVVELGPDFWCPDCGLLDLSEFSADFSDAGFDREWERAKRQFEDTYGHGLS